MIKYLIVILLSILSTLNGYCQSSSNRQVIIRGRVVDTLADTPIAAATVSIYQKKSGKILKYGFTNNTGFFNLADIPLRDSTLLLQISYIGYATLEMDINQLFTQTEFNLGIIRMKSESMVLEEVRVHRPPIVMNRDTLEINPEAFDLQPNAVVEDLLTKVPGIVVWGDGLITVNGKKVANVLVEGKPFFGRNPVIATRNLPADAIDKIKVYDSPSNIQHKEVRLEVDIILKNGKKKGLFGKVAFSEGSANHREGTFLINLFNPKDQISLFAGGNNTNKVARHISDFLAANVYKPGGENLDSNTPMFGQTGLNKFFITGAKFERRWNDQFNTNIELLHNDRKSENQRDIQEVRLFEEGGKQHIVENQQDNKHEDRQSYLGTAKHKSRKWDFRINSGIQQMQTSQDQHYRRGVTDQEGQKLSHLDKEMHSREQNRKGRLGFDLRLNDSLDQKFELSYKFEVENRNLEQQENIIFTNTAPLDRLKQNKQSGNRNEMDVNIGLDRLLNSTIGHPINLTFDLRNSFVFRQIDENQLDMHLDPSTDTYTIENRAISYSDQLKEIIWTPEITVTKGLIKMIGKGQNSLLFTTALGVQSASRKNNSDHQLRELDQRFLYVLPSASVRYERARQLANKSLTLAYQSLVNQPEINQLIGLVDTTQKDFNRIGNRALRPKEQYQFSLEYTDVRYVKNMSQRLRITYSLQRNELTDNSIYLSDGSLLVQAVNTTGLPVFRTDYQYKIGKKVWNRPLNLELFGLLNGGQHYFYNNNIRYKSRLINSWFQTRAHYEMLDCLKIGILGSLSTNWNSSDISKSQAGAHSLGFDFVLTWPRRTTLISRFVTKRFYTKGLPSDQQYLWNIDVYYRMLKKEQLEIKLSAFDLLKNNRTIQNVLQNNVVRQVKLNNIQQFFMIGLAYYPRMF